MVLTERSAPPPHVLIDARAAVSCSAAAAASLQSSVCDALPLLPEREVVAASGGQRAGGAPPGVSSFGGIMERAARIRRSGREGARSATGYPGAPRHAIRNRSAGNAGRISGSADRDTHKTPVTSSSSSLSNMCARSRSEMLLTRSSVRVELFLGLKASNPV